MTHGSVTGKGSQHALQALAERLRDGPLMALIMLHRRAEGFTEEEPSGEDLIEALESLVHLMETGMSGFHEFAAELQRLVDGVVDAGAEPRVDELADRARAN
jgi:hypothetical protein